MNPFFKIAIITIIMIVQVFQFIWTVEYFSVGNIQSGIFMMVLTLPFFIMNIISLYRVIKNELTF